MGKLDEKIIVNRLAKIKYLYKIGIEQSMQEGTFAGFSLLSFHDCAEMFLLLVAEEHGDKIEENRPIGQFAGCDSPQSPINTVVLRDSNV